MRRMICFGIAESCCFRWIFVIVIFIVSVMVMAIVVSVIDHRSRVSSLLRNGV